MTHSVPKVTLVDWTHRPDLVLYVLWHASRTDEPLFTVTELERQLKTDALLAHRVDETFCHILGAAIPVAEAVRFVFLFEHITVAWREQLVRHRTNAYWSQSSRARPLDEFWEGRIFWTPPEVAGRPDAQKVWDACMQTIGQTYQQLEAMGISRDNARGVLPQYSTHRIGMTINLRSLAELVRTRSCWIAQSDLWHPILAGMLAEIRTKVDERLASLLGAPPCARGGEYGHCPIGPDNLHRLRGEDPEPPCPLWLAEIGHQGDFYRADRAKTLLSRFQEVWHPALVVKAAEVVA